MTSAEEQRKGIRAFVAIDPSEGPRREIGAFQEEIRTGRADVRWVTIDAAHLTLEFLGSVPEEKVGEVEQALAEQLENQPALDVEWVGTGVFPNPKRPRVAWIGLRGEGIAELAGKVEEALEPLGFPREKRKFTPHLTIARVRSPKGWKRVWERLEEARDRSFGTDRIEEVTLYRSDLRPTGAVYTPIRRLRLR